ncbi:MAG TPA: class I SAM-dependent methyltransferase [Blastocatellia bacterium]|nr:class I SAM-dependent methyltransferase [Blastocatellia bacterium]
MSESNVQQLFGNIDIYLFDQLLKGRFIRGMRVLDAGCGTGRNLVYFLRNGYEVFAVDQSEESIREVRKLASVLAPHLPADNFRVEPVERMSFGIEANSSQQTVNSKATSGTHNLMEKSGGGFDCVLSSAVLHFARDEEQWQAMVDEMWRVLKPSGIFFARLASTIGMEGKIKLISGRRYHLPDGSDRFLVDQAMLKNVTAALGGEFIEPIKTTVVENLRAMTTWVVRKC